MNRMANICLKQEVRAAYRIRTAIVGYLYEQGRMLSAASDDAAMAMPMVSLRFQKAFTIMRCIANRRE